MKTEIDMIRVKLENMRARAVREREALSARIAQLDREINATQKLLDSIKDVTNESSDPT